jgi:hypothetical protein
MLSRQALYQFGGALDVSACPHLHPLNWHPLNWQARTPCVRWGHALTLAVVERSASALP